MLDKVMIVLRISYSSFDMLLKTPELTNIPFELNKDMTRESKTGKTVQTLNPLQRKR